MTGIASYEESIHHEKSRFETGTIKSDGIIKPYDYYQETKNHELKNIAEQAYELYKITTQIEHFTIKTPDLTNSLEPAHNIDLMNRLESIN